MSDYELTRTPDDRRLYALDGIGTLRLEGLASRSATARAAGRTWKLARRGFWRRSSEASDATGATVGGFKPFARMRRGGTVRWDGRELALHPARRWRECYALVDADREVAILDGKGWGQRPVSVTVDPKDSIEPGLLLFATFVVHGLAEDAAGATGATAAVGA